MNRVLSILMTCCLATPALAYDWSGAKWNIAPGGSVPYVVNTTLTVDVPVPTEAAARTRTPYIWLQPWLLPFGALLPLVCLFLLRRRLAREES